MAYSTGVCPEAFCASDCPLSKAASARRSAGNVFMVGEFFIRGIFIVQKRWSNFSVPRLESDHYDVVLPKLKMLFEFTVPANFHAAGFQRQAVVLDFDFGHLGLRQLCG